MSKSISQEMELKSWRTSDGRFVEIIIPLFSWQSVEMVNIQTLRRERRLIWGYDGNKLVSLFQQARSGGAVLIEPPKYELKPINRSSKYPSGYKKVRMRQEVNGLTVCAIKLSTLTYGQNNMSLPISPSELKKFIDDNFRLGNFIGTESSCKFVLVRTNDLKREMTPKNDDKWIVLRTVNPKTIQNLIKPINEVEKNIDSSWREASTDPKLTQILEEINQ